MIPKYDRVPASGKSGYREFTVTDAGTSGLAVGTTFTAKVEMGDEATVEGTNINRAALIEFLAASGTTAGTASALTLTQADFSLFDGAQVMIKLHTNIAAGATLNINGTGAKAIVFGNGLSVGAEFEAGAWVRLIYSTTNGEYVIQTNGVVAIKGTITGVAASSSGSVTLPSAPSFALVRLDGDTTLSSGTEFCRAALLFDGDSQKIFNNSYDDTDMTASLSGSTLTITNTNNGSSSSLLFNYVAFYV